MREGCRAFAWSRRAQARRSHLPFLGQTDAAATQEGAPRETACGDVLEDLPKIDATGRQSGDGTRRPGDTGGIETRFTTAADFLLTLSVAHAQDQLKEGCSERSTPTSIAWGSTWAGISLDVVTAGKVCVSFEVPLTTGNRQHQ
jgi:hypothetical protein